MRLKTDWITVRIDPEAKKFVQNVAAELNISVSEYILRCATTVAVSRRIFPYEQDALKLQMLLDGTPLKKITSIAIENFVYRGVDRLGCDYMEETIYDLLSEDVCGLMSDWSEIDNSWTGNRKPINWELVAKAIAKGEDWKSLIPTDIIPDEEAEAEAAKTKLDQIRRRMMPHDED